MHEHKRCVSMYMDKKKIIYEFGNLEKFGGNGYGKC